jgi:integrase
LTEANLRQVEGRWAFEIIGKGNKYRGVAIPNWAFAWIKDWLKCLPGDRQSREGYPILRRVHGQGWTGTRGVGAGVLTGEAVRLILLSILDELPILGEDGEPVRLRPHDLRRTWAVLGLRNGASLDMVRNGLGHSDLATTQKYLHGADEMRPGMAVGDLVVNSLMLTDSWWEKIRKDPVEWAKWKIVLNEKEKEKGETI